MLKTRRKRKLFFLAFLVIFIALYLEVGLTPGALRLETIRKIENYSHKRINFSKAIYIPFYGLSLYDFRLGDYKGNLIFSSRKLTLNIEALEFIKSKKIVLSNVHIDGPVYDLVLDQMNKPPKETLPVRTRMSGQIEIPAIQANKRPDVTDIDLGPNAFLPDNVYLEQIQIHNGLVNIRKSIGSPLIEKMTSINLRLGFQKPPKLNLEGSFDLGEKTYSSVELKGLWDLDTANYLFNLDWRSKKVPDWLLDYQNGRFLILKQGRFHLMTSLKSVQEDRALFRAKAVLGDSIISVKSTDYLGPMEMDAVGQFNFTEKRFESYRGNLKLKEIDIQNLTPAIPLLKKIKGEVEFRPDHLGLKRIEGFYQNLNFTADGNIDSFKELFVDIAIRTETNLQAILSILPAKNRQWFKDFKISGDCKALSRVKGALKDSPKIKLTHYLILQNGDIRSANEKLHLENVSAEINAGDNGLSIKNAQFTSQRKEYRAALFIPKDLKTKGDLKLINKDFTLQSKYRWLQDQIEFQNAELKTTAGTALFQGFIRELKNPYLNLQGTLRLNLVPATAFYAKQFPFLKSLEAVGELAGPFNLQGYWENPLAWTFNLDASSDPLFIKKSIRLDDFKMQIRMAEKLISIPYMHAFLYGGNAGASLTLDLREPNSPSFGIKLYANQVDVNALTRAIDPKKNLSGTGSLQLSLKGLLKSTASIQGSGSVDVQNGMLWKTDRFKAMGQLPLVKVEGLNEVIFTSLTSTFDVRQKRIWTKDLILKSEPVDLLLSGSFGFDQTLDLVMNIQFSSQVIEGAFDAGGIAPFVVQQAGKFISKYKIYGTFARPLTDKA